MTAVREAMAAQVNRYAFPALRTLADLEDQVNPPVGLVMPGRAPYITYGTTLQGENDFLGAPVLGSTIAPTEFSLDLLIILSKASTIERVEMNLDAWLGVESDGTAVSVPVAVGSDPTLGGLVEWCVPVSADPPGPITYNGAEFFGARIHFSLSAR